MYVCVHVCVCVPIAFPFWYQLSFTGPIENNCVPDPEIFVRRPVLEASVVLVLLNKQLN